MAVRRWGGTTVGQWGGATVRQCDGTTVRQGDGEVVGRCGGGSSAERSDLALESNCGACVLGFEQKTAENRKDSSGNE